MTTLYCYFSIENYIINNTIKLLLYEEVILACSIGQLFTTGIVEIFLLNKYLCSHLILYSFLKEGPSK